VKTGVARRAGVAALVSLAIGCRPAPSGPPPRCTEAWSRVPPAARTYDFDKDAKRTKRGNEGYGRFADRLPRRGCTKSWTVLVYMAADADDLGAPALRDLAAIEDPAARAGSTEIADVIVQLDRKAPDGLLRLHMFRAPSAEAGAIRSPIVEALPEETGRPEESLSRFLEWGIDRYPSDRYAVVVWGHGLGWRPEGAATPLRYDRAGTTGGVAFDETQGTALDTPSLARALRTASNARLGGRPFDLYASDACLMQSIEVAAELSGVARFVVGSEQIEEDYLGLPYGSWLPAINGAAPLAETTRCDASDVACRAAAALPLAQRSEVDRSAAPSAGFTLSSVHERALTTDLVPAMRELGAALDAYMREDDLRRIGLLVLLGDDRGPTRGTPAFRGGTRDLGVLLGRLEQSALRQPHATPSPAHDALLAAVRDTRAALGKAVIAAALGERYRAVGFEGMAGLSVWLPRDADEHRRRARFFAPSLLDRESPSFRGFLDRLFAAPPS
jgi:hypothetical protein